MKSTESCVYYFTKPFCLFIDPEYQDLR